MERIHLFSVSSIVVDSSQSSREFLLQVANSYYSNAGSRIAHKTRIIQVNGVSIAGKQFSNTAFDWSIKHTMDALLACKSFL